MTHYYCISFNDKQNWVDLYISHNIIKIWLERIAIGQTINIRKSKKLSTSRKTRRKRKSSLNRYRNTLDPKRSKSMAKWIKVSRNWKNKVNS